MTTIRFDVTGPYQIRWPSKEDDIIAQADVWITYESSRNAADQLKDTWLALIQTQNTVAKTARAGAKTGEAARSVTQAEFQAKLDQARHFLTLAHNILKLKHPENVFQLEYRGFNVRQTARGLSVRMPKKTSEILALLETYVTYESTLGPAQLADPPLATLQALLVDLQDLGQNRGSSRTQRTSNIYTRSTATARLAELLQGAGLALVQLKFGGQVHPDLANWGYTVVGSTPPEPGDPPEGEPPVEPPAE